MSLISDTDLMDILRKSGVVGQAYKAMTVTRWKDGIDLDYPSAELRWLADAILAAEPRRDERQKVVVEWGTRCFGADHMQDRIVRAARFIEEAAELAQAVGLTKEHAIRAIDHVYSRDPGQPWQEAGGSAVTLMALCDAIGLSADDCERREIARCLSKQPEHFAARNRAKIEQVDKAP